MPASTSLVCTASLESLEGRKAWVVAEVMDRPGGVLYASGRALFVIPKDKVGGHAACQLMCHSHKLNAAYVSIAGFIGVPMATSGTSCGLVYYGIWFIMALGMQMLPPSKASEGAAFAASQENGGTETETELERLSIAT